MDEEFKKKATEHHSGIKAGRTEPEPKKPFDTPEEPSLANLPDATRHALEIHKERWKAYRYTNKGNLVAVVSNGSHIDGAGNVGATASKPIMEDKAMLFKTFADIDAFDIEINDENPDNAIATIQSIAPTFGAINLEGIKTPDSFYIADKLQRLLDIPVIDDNKHSAVVGIVTTLIHFCHTTGKDIERIKIVVCAAESPGLSIAEILCNVGAQKENITTINSKKSVSAQCINADGRIGISSAANDCATLTQAIINADVFIGAACNAILNDAELEIMSERPIIFVPAHHTPANFPERAHNIRPDALIFTSDTSQPNGINCSLLTPYLLRGALDTLSTSINDTMLTAAAKAIIDYRNAKPCNGLSPFEVGNGELLTLIAAAVAHAAIDSGVARRSIVSFGEYRDTLLSRVNNKHSFAKENVRHHSKIRSHSGHENRKEKL